jgi:hypothetical protein
MCAIDTSLSVPIILIPKFVGRESLTVIGDFFPSEVLVLLVIHRPIVWITVVKVVPTRVRRLASETSAPVIAQRAWECCGGDSGGAIIASKGA